MAEDKRVIRIEVVNIETKDNEPKELTPQQKANKKARANQKTAKEITDHIVHPVKSLVEDAVGSSVKGQAVLQLAQQSWGIITQTIDYSINRNLNLSENYIAQNDYNRIKGTYGLITSGASSVASGIVSGAAFGWAGAIVGGLAGGVNWAAQTALQQSERYSQYYQQLNATNFNTQYNQKRAGLYDGSRGTES